MVTPPKLKSSAPAPNVTNPLYPAEIDGYLTAKIRVELIARLKFNTKVSTLVALPEIQQFLIEQGFPGDRAITRNLLEEPQWRSLADWLQWKPTQKNIREALLRGSKAGGE